MKIAVIGNDLAILPDDLHFAKNFITLTVRGFDFSAKTKRWNRHSSANLKEIWPNRLETSGIG